MTHVPIIIYDRTTGEPIGEYWPPHDGGEGNLAQEGKMVLDFEKIIELYNLKMNEGKKED